MEFVFGGQTEEQMRSKKPLNLLDPDKNFTRVDVAPRLGASDFYVLVDYDIKFIQVDMLKNIIDHQLAMQDKQLNYSIINVLKYKVSEGLRSKKVRETYNTKNLSLKEMGIPSGAKILAMGRSLASITGTSDINYTHFFNKYNNVVLNAKSDIVSAEKLHSKYLACPINAYADKEDQFVKVWSTPPPDTFIKVNLKEQTAVAEDNFYKKFFSKAVEYVANNTISRMPMRPPELALHEIETVPQLLQFLLDTANHKEMTWDLETSGLDFKAHKIGCFTCSFDGREGWFIPWKLIEGIKPQFSAWLKKKFQIGANLKFDCKFLWQNGVEGARIDFDTLQAGHVIDETRSQSLKSHAWYYTLYGGYDKELEKAKEDNPDLNYLQLPKQKLVKYATYDAIVTFLVYLAMKEEIQLWDQAYPLTEEWSHDTSWGLWRYLTTIVIPATYRFAKVEFQGMMINAEKLVSQGRYMNMEIQKSKRRLDELFDFLPEDTVISDEEMENYRSKFNWSSADKLGVLLEQHGWKCHGRGKAKKKAPDKTKELIRSRCSPAQAELEIEEWSPYKSNDDILQLWLKDFRIKRDNKAVEVVQAIQHLRTLSTVFSTFLGDKREGTGYWQYIRKSNDGLTVHPNFAVMRADSGRNKCSKPNLQNVPSHGDNAEIVRPIFCTPNEDTYFISADQSGLQLRLGAIYSGDVMMRKIFCELSGDMHSMTAWNVFIKNNPKPTRVVTFKDGSVERFKDWDKIMVVDSKGEQVTDVAINLVEGSIVILEEHEEQFVQSIVLDTEAMEQMTFEDLLSVKKLEPYAHIRFSAKSLNFGLLFGGSAKMLCDTAIIPEWSDTQVYEFLAESVGSTEDIEDMISGLLSSNYYSKEDKFDQLSEEKKVEWAYMLTATVLRNSFFESYSGLVDWHNKFHDLSNTFGFVRTPFGAFRRLPELQDYKDRKKDNSMVISNKKNISLNSPIQGFEAGLMMLSMVKMCEYLEENDMKSSFVGAVHDAWECYIDKDEIAPFVEKTHFFAESDPEILPLLQGIPLVMEGNISDYWGKDQLWDLGTDMDKLAKNVQVA